MPDANPYGYPECGKRDDAHHCRLEREHLGPHECYRCRSLWLLTDEAQSVCQQEPEPEPETPLCRYLWPDPSDTLGRPHVCGLLSSHEGPHQAIGYTTSYYDDEGVWHNGGRHVLAEAPNA